jgi:hypothetical protein
MSAAQGDTVSEPAAGTKAGNVQPGNVQPGSVLPGNDQPGNGQAGNGQPGLRGDRVYLGWQYALLHPHPGPPPRRPTPPERHNLDPGWVAAQHREDAVLNRPLRAALSGAAVGAAFFAAMWLAGWVPPLLAGFCILVCASAAALAGRALWHAGQVLRSHVAEEQRRIGKIRAWQDRGLFARQAEHARQAGEWQARRAAYERQKQWYAVCLPREIDRVDVAGGTLAGWSAMLTMMGAPRLDAGGEVTVLDLSEGAVARDLLAVARRSGTEPLVWLLPGDLPRLDLGTGLGAGALADVLSLTASAFGEHGAARDLPADNALLERVIGVLGDGATVAGVTAGLRVLAQVGDPRDDVRRGLLSAEQADQLTAMFGPGAAERVVIERAWALESQLRKLESVGSGLVPLPPARLRVVSLDKRAGAVGNRVLGTYLVTALTHVLRQAAAGPRWQHTVFLLGAETLRGEVLDRLAGACESTGTGLVMAYRSIPEHVRQRLGRGNAAIAFMRLGNAADAKVASEQIGTQHRFVLSQLTTTAGTSVTDTTGDSYASTVGTAESVSASASQTVTSGRSVGRGASHGNSFLPMPGGMSSRSRDTSHSAGSATSSSLTESISSSTTWGISTSRALADSESLGRTAQRSREFLVEQHELQQLPPSAMIVTYAAAGGRHIIAADANPAILGLPTATLLPLDEARSAMGAGTQTRARHTGAAAGQPSGEHGRDGDGRSGPGHPDGGEGPAGRSGSSGTSGPGGGPAAGRPAPGAAAGQVAATVPMPVVPVSWRGRQAPPPNLGPPPERPDWRRPRDQ